MRIHRAAAALTLGLCGALVAAGTGSAGAAGALTEPQAKAIANVGVVMAKDLPGDYFTPPRSANEPDRRAEAAFYRCLGAPAPTYLARNAGLKFLWAEKIGSPEAKTLEVDSKAGVADSAVAAGTDQENWRSAKAIGCYRQGLEKALARNLRGTAKAITVDLVEANVAGADEAWAYRVTFTVTGADGKDVDGNGYLLGARVGQALLTIAWTGSGKEYSLDEVTAVAAKPIARAKQATPKA